VAEGATDGSTDVWPLAAVMQGGCVVPACGASAVAVVTDMAGKPFVWHPDGTFLPDLTATKPPVRAGSAGRRAGPSESSADSVDGNGSDEDSSDGSDMDDTSSDDVHVVFNTPKRAAPQCCGTSPPRLTPASAVHLIATVLEGATAADAAALGWSLTPSHAWAAALRRARAADALVARAIYARSVAAATAAVAAAAPADVTAAAVADAAARTASVADTIAAVTAGASADALALPIIPVSAVRRWQVRGTPAAAFYTRRPQPVPAAGGLVDVRRLLTCLVSDRRVGVRPLLAALVLLRRAVVATPAAALSGWTAGRLLPAAVLLASTAQGGWGGGGGGDDAGEGGLSLEDAVGVGRVRDAAEAAALVAALRGLLGGHVRVDAVEVGVLEWLLVHRYGVLTGGPPPRG